jgi:hypothetical protein
MIALTRQTPYKQEISCNPFPPIVTIFPTFSCFARITFHVTSNTKGHKTCLGACIKALVVCDMPPHICNMPKTCITRSQSMYGNAKVKNNGAKDRLGKEKRIVALL